jgi:hypothetical protein
MCRSVSAWVTRHVACPMRCTGVTVTGSVAVSTSPWAPRIVVCSSYLPGTRQLVSIYPAMAYGGSWKCVAVPVSGRGSCVSMRTRTRNPATIRTRGSRVMARTA